MDRSTFTIIALSAVVAVESFFLFKPTDDPIVAKFSGETIRSSQLNAELRERFGRDTLQDIITERLLDKAIAKYSEAMQLAKVCGDKLNNAKESINKILTENNTLEDFSIDENKN